MFCPSLGAGRWHYLGVSDLLYKAELRASARSAMYERLRCHGLELVTFLESFSSPAVAVAEDLDGSRWVAKIEDPDDEIRGEETTLRAWEGFPKCRRLERDLLLLERLPGEQIGQHREARDYRLLGETIYELHQSAAPSGLLTCAELTESIRGKLMKSQRLTDQEKQLAAKAYPSLIQKPEVLLHGDLHFRNALINQKDIRLIDPVGLSGPAAFDLAAFVANLSVPRHFEVAEALIAGYGQEPPGFADYLSFMAVARYHNALRWVPEEAPGRRLLLEQILQDG